MTDKKTVKQVSVTKQQFCISCLKKKKAIWPGSIFTKCHRIRKTSSFYICDCLLRQSNDSRVIAIRSEKDIEHIKNHMDNPRNPN